MSHRPLVAVMVSLLAVPVGAAPVPKEPPAWPMFGGTPARNMVNLREKLPPLPKEGPKWDDEETVKKWEAEWVLWKAELGFPGYHSATTSSPIVAGGRVYIGTNNARPRNKRDTKKDSDGHAYPVDMGVLMCFDEKTGKFLWQAVHDKIPRTDDRIEDWSKIGVSSTPAVVGDRVYYVSNRCTVVCADVHGFANGNQGFQGEKNKDDTDADILWEYDMRELMVPRYASNCSPLIVEDRIFVCTSNGVDTSLVKVPSPDAPALICLDRNTGKLLWKDASPGKDIMHGQWCNPAYAHEPVPQVIHGQGDGWLRAFDPTTGKLLWKFDCNKKGTTYGPGGAAGERSPIVAMPVVYDGRVYTLRVQE
jgi:outer membrane protein assembly factor BamB